MNADRKFLVVACVALALPIIYRVAPCAVLLLAASLLVVAYILVTQNRPL